MAKFYGFAPRSTDPWWLPDTSYTTNPSKIHTVNAGGNLQTAISGAASGDLILLESGATFTGPFTLPDHGGSSPITICTNGLHDGTLEANGFPRYGQRVRTSDASALATLTTTTNNTSPLTVGVTTPHHWNIRGVRLTADASHTSGARGLFDLTYYADEPATEAELPHHFLLDRVLLNPDPDTEFLFDATIGAACNLIGLYVTLRGCYVSVLGTTTDYKVLVSAGAQLAYFCADNCNFDGGSETVFLGGGGGPNTLGVPSHHLKIVRSRIGKPADMTGYYNKNLYESKMSVDVVLDGILFDGRGHTANQNYLLAFPFYPDPPVSGGSEPVWGTQRRIAIANSIIRNGYAGGINLRGETYEGGTYTSYPGRNHTIRNILMYGMGNNGYSPISAQMAPAGLTINKVTIDHTTWLYQAILCDYGGIEDDIGDFDALSITDSIFSQNQYSSLLNGANLLDANFINSWTTSNRVISKNLHLGGQNVPGTWFGTGASPTDDDAQNWMPAYSGARAALFVDPANADFRVKASSVYYAGGARDASDGASLGCDHAALKSALSVDDWDLPY